MTTYDVDALWNSLSLERKISLVRENYASYNMSEADAQTFEFTAPLSHSEICDAFIENKRIAVMTKTHATVDKILSDNVVERTEIVMDGWGKVTPTTTMMTLEDYQAFDYNMTYDVDPSH